MNDEIKFDHFENINELLEHIDLWYEEEDVYYERWFGLNDLKKLKDYITNLQIKIGAYELFDNQKIERLEKENERYRIAINEMAINISKAIEYINNHSTYGTPSRLPNGIYERGDLVPNCDFYSDDLLEILKGSDKE